MENTKKENKDMKISKDMSSQESNPTLTAQEIWTGVVCILSHLAIEAPQWSFFCFVYLFTYFLHDLHDSLQTLTKQSTTTFH